MYEKNTLKIVDRREQLKIKVNSLAEEAKLIRKAEKKTHGQLREELFLHRIHVVRAESRSASLALGFIKGRTWEEMEINPDTLPDWKRVKTLFQKYGPAANSEKAKAFNEMPCLSLNPYDYALKQINRRNDIRRERVLKQIYEQAEKSAAK